MLRLTSPRVSRSISSLTRVVGLSVLTVHVWPLLCVCEGYGDCALTTAGARVFAACFALTSVGALSAAFEGVSAAKTQAK
jgi:hypothetical protein